MSTLLRRWRDWLPLLIILAVGAVLRFYRAGELPPGLYRDEAFYGLDALGVLRGHPAIFFAANNGREGLFMYLLAAGIALIGRTPLALCAVSATVGTLTLVAVYACGRNLFSHRIGVLSAGIMAVTFWHVALSRVAFRAITLPLLLCITIALGAAVIRRLNSEPNSHPKWLAVKALMAGVAFGLTFYTYTSGQFLLALIVAFAVLWALLRALRVHGFTGTVSPAVKRTVLLMLLGAVVMLAPFAFWLTRHADIYFLRAEQVSILSPVINKGDLVGTLLGNIMKAAGMFAWQGDRIWRHNLSLRPVFDGGVALAFWVGVVACLWRIVKRPAVTASPPAAPALLFVLLWLVIFLVPTVLAEDTPHYLRAIGALPAACLIAAIGLEAVLAWLSRRGFLNFYAGRLRRMVSPPAVVAAAVLVMAGISTMNDYFDNYVRQDMTAYWLEDSNVQLAEAVNDYTRTNIPSTLWLQDRLQNDNPALRFLSPDVEQGKVTVVSTAGRAPPAPSQVLLLVDPTHDWTSLRNALPAPSELQVTPGPLAQGDLDTAPHQFFIAVLAKPAPPSQPMATFERGIQVQRASIQVPSGITVTADHLPLTLNAASLQNANTPSPIFTVTVQWRATQPITEDLAIYVHWQRNQDVIAQHDGSPARGYLPMPTWRPGDVIADPHPVIVAGSPQAGDVIYLGVYRRSDNARLRVLGTKGNLPADEVQIALVH